MIAFLGLGVVGLTSSDEATVRGAYLVTEQAGRYALVPLALTLLLGGLVQSLGTPSGLVRHYWVIFKLGITGFATAVLLFYLVTSLRDVAASDASLDGVRSSLAGAARGGRAGSPARRHRPGDLQASRDDPPRSAALGPLAGFPAGRA